MSDANFNDLMQQAAWMENSPAKVAVLEQAVREADALQDIQSGYMARMDLVEAATFGGAQEKALVAFTWCLAQVDKDPERFDENMILWSYKWVLENCYAFPQISMNQIDKMLDDFQQRLQRQNASPRTAHYMRWSAAMNVGKLDEARRYVELWLEAPRDSFADCPACERNRHVQLMVAMARDEEALQVAEPILKGRMRCAEIPHGTLAHILAPLLRLGRAEEAGEHHARGYRLISKNPEFLQEAAEHLVFVTSRSDLKKGLKLVERHLPWAVETASLDRRFHFYTAAGLLLERLAAGSDKPRKVRLPADLPCRREDDTYPAGELAAWFTGAAARLAERFNQRNGNDYFTRLQADHRRLALAE